MYSRGRIFFILALGSAAVALTFLNQHQKLQHPLFSSAPEGKVVPEEQHLYPPLPAFTSEESPDEMLKWSQEDPRLISYIRRHHLKKPSTLPYNMSYKGYHPTEESSMFLETKKPNARTGTFIEAGALDGEHLSNTLYLEELGWKGLLVEPNPMILPNLYAKNRKAWISDVCLSLSNTAQVMNLSSLKELPATAQFDKPLTADELRDLDLGWAIGKPWTNVSVTCFPLYSVLKATNEFSNDEVDFLSLDVQGAEMGVLKHFPFHKFKIRAMWVEVHTYTEEQITDLRKFLEGNGYKLEMNHDSNYDHLYVLQ